MDISEKKTMRLRLNLSEVEMQLKISDWQSSKEDADLDLEWCDVELSLTGEYIKYGPCGELLMNYEVSDLCIMAPSNQIFDFKIIKISIPKMVHHCCYK